MGSLFFVVLCIGVVVVLTFAKRPLRVVAAGNEPEIKVGNVPKAYAIGSTPHISNVVRNEFIPPQTGQAEKTVDKTRKNIQILKGLLESDLFLLMNFVATSLGVDCNFTLTLKRRCFSER